MDCILHGGSQRVGHDWATFTFIIIISILYIAKLRFREVEQFVHGHTAVKWQNTYAVGPSAEHITHYNAALCCQRYSQGACRVITWSSRLLIWMMYYIPPSPFVCSLLCLLTSTGLTPFLNSILFHLLLPQECPSHLKLTVVINWF